jgi:outer membrane protein OmpA-like peptidoglycan-associated protein
MTSGGPRAPEKANPMTSLRIGSLLLVSGLAFGCAAVAPTELVNAREAYRRAAAGPASTSAPAELHVADVALTKAELAFRQEDDGFRTRDLAYVAQRKAQLAEATASIVVQKKNQDIANKDFTQTQGQLVEKTKSDLTRSRSDLAVSEQGAADAAARLAVEQTARKAAEQRSLDAQAALARLAAVKEEPRGVVITLSGSVLFASNRSTLLPAARTRLDQVSEVLLTTKERKLSIEGHTDSQGSNGRNQQLSQSRAEAVRSYLIERGYAGDLIQAKGMGEGSPVADNGNAEGRANNRRVEIIIEREAQTSTR